MRNPLPVLAAAMLAAAGAFAGDLPTWTAVDEGHGAWRQVDFRDAVGTYHQLYCRTSECGYTIKKGQAPLYILEHVGTETYQASVAYQHDYSIDPQTAPGWKLTWEWLKEHTALGRHWYGAPITIFKSQVSKFVLDMSTTPNKAVIKGTDVAIAVEPEGPAVSDPNGKMRVLAPVGFADDAPKAQPAPQPGHVPLPRHRPGSTAGPKPGPQPAPGAHVAAPELSALETGWLYPDQRGQYSDDLKPAKTRAAKRAVYKKYRDLVSGNLRDDLKAPYKALLDGGQYDKIDDLLAGKNYAGWDVMLKPEEYEALKKVLKTADAHADFTQPNAAAQYDQEMKGILSPEGKPKASEHLQAHKITAKFRAMVPPPPGAPATVDPAAPLTDADWAKITDQNDRDALKKLYDADFAKADTPDKKAGVNKDYRAKIDDWVAKHPQTSSPLPIDFEHVKTKDDFLRLSKDDKTKLCGMLMPTGGGVLDCGDILGNADAATAKCMSMTGANGTDSTQAKAQCMEHVNACKAHASGGASTVPTPAGGAATDAVREQCHLFWAGATPPPPQIGSGVTDTNPKLNSSPCGDKGGKAKPKDGAASANPADHAATTDVDPCPPQDKPGPDPNFYTNLGNGLAFGVGGLLLASFLGGPLLMLAVAVAAGAGGYYFSKSVTEPKKDKDKDKK